MLEKYAIMATRLDAAATVKLMLAITAFLMLDILQFATNAEIRSSKETSNVTMVVILVALTVKLNLVSYVQKIHLLSVTETTQFVAMESSK